ncbi:two-component regulator propeller domain-containing protein [Fluviicola sp.]|uniref:ligand-binding sensor domain-containing protein n=1 Tax=Fluviicola sp. TaxID=1917219 RepID=UPI0031E19531
MKRTQLIYILLTLISVSCGAQVQADSPKTETVRTIAQPKLVRSQGTDEYANVHCSLEDKNGNLWFGTTGEGLYKYDGKEFTNFLVKDGLSSNHVWCAYEDNTGKLWFGTDDGVCCYDPASPSKGFTTYRLEGKISAVDYKHQKNPVHAIYQDKSGQFWFGTDHGVFKSVLQTNKESSENEWSFVPFFSGNNLIVNPKNLHLRGISAIIQDQSGKMWFASWNNEGACSFDGKALTNFEPNGDNMVYSLLEDKAGNLWFGTREHGVCRYDGIGPQKSYTNFADIATFSTSSIASMVEDKNGQIWFGTEFGSGSLEDKKGGVWRYDPKSNAFTNFTVAGDGLTNNSVFTVLKTRSDDFWFGTRNMGLCKFDPAAKGKKFVVFSE